MTSLKSQKANAEKEMNNGKESFLRPIKSIYCHVLQPSLNIHQEPYTGSKLVPD